MHRPRRLRIGDLHATSPEQVTVLAGQANRLAAELVDEHHQFLLHLAGQYPLDDLHRLGIGYPQAVKELGFLADANQGIVNLRPATVNDDGLHAHELEHHHIACKTLLEPQVHHGIAAVLDDDGATMKTLDIGQRFGEDFRLQLRGDLGAVHRK